MKDRLRVNIVVSFQKDWHIGYGEQEASLEIPHGLMVRMRASVENVTGKMFMSGLKLALDELAEKEKEEQDE